MVWPAGSIGPLHKQRHANTTLKVVIFNRDMERSRRKPCGTTVVAGKHNDSVVGQAFLLQRILFHAAVYRSWQRKPADDEAEYPPPPHSRRGSPAGECECTMREVEENGRLRLALITLIDSSVQ